MARIRAAEAAAGREEGSVGMIAAVKYADDGEIRALCELGVHELGENRVQQLLAHCEALGEEREKVRFHFIGSLQTNKVKYIIDKVTMIHSVDSMRLAEEINRRAGQHDKIMDILVEVNIGEEDTKGGIAPADVKAFCEDVMKLPNVRLRGLMTIPPPDAPEELYARMQQLFNDIRDAADKESAAHFDTLSMGMSGDYATAIRYGSTIIRIGSGLFGYRRYNSMA